MPVSMCCVVLSLYHPSKTLEFWGIGIEVSELHSEFFKGHHVVKFVNVPALVSRLDAYPFLFVAVYLTHHIHAPDSKQYINPSTASFSVCVVISNSRPASAYK